MDDSAAEPSQSFTANGDICEQLLTRYARSSAAQHRHLCATAAATRSIIQSSSLPLSPISYFAATITSLSNFKELDSDAIGAVTSFLSILIPLVSRGEIKPEKAAEAVRVLVGIVDENADRLGTSGVRGVVKCVGILLAEFCNLEEWDSVALGFNSLLKFSLDKRPKVRKCALDCLLTVLKLFKSPAISKASKSIYALLKDHSLAIEMTASDIGDGSKDETMLRPEQQEVLHLLNVMKHAGPILSPKIRTRVLTELLKVLTSQFSVVTRQIFDVISAIFITSGTEIVIFNYEDIIKSMVSYISMGNKNPVDSIMSAATLAKTALGKLHESDKRDWTTYFSMLVESLAGFLSVGGEVSLQTSTVLRELIDNHIDGKSLSKTEGKDTDDKAIDAALLKSIESLCAAFFNVLDSSPEILNENLYSVVAFLFLKLGQKSGLYMKCILLKLGDLMDASSSGDSETKHLQDCIGSAVVAMGPEEVLRLLPISFCVKACSFSNIWLIPILEKNVVGSSLRFFMENIVPLAESFEKASRKVKKSVIGQDLQAYARGLWRLLPAFCRQPTDTYQCFEALAKLLIPYLKMDSFMLDNIAVSLQKLVNENKSALASNGGSMQPMQVQRTDILDGPTDLKSIRRYSKKIANENIKALALCARDFLQALTDVWFQHPHESQEHLKGAIECLGSICDVSVTKDIFVASLEKYQLLDETGEHEIVDCNSDPPTNGKESNVIDAKGCQLLDFASCIVQGCDDDLAKLLFSVIKRAMQSSNEAGQIKACKTLSKILEKNTSFLSSQFDGVMDLLAGVKSTENLSLLESRFSCLQALLIHALMRNTDEENTEAFLILNEMILALKDSNEEGRKAAYDALNGISFKLRGSSDAPLDGLYHKLLSMITGYLSGSSPHIKSGVVSALSVLVYNDPDICTLVPDIVPAVMELLHSKSIEVIKAVLGFVKVLVSCIKPNDLQHLLSDIMDGIIRWSSVSRHHFKTKVVVILEIMMRKCGAAAVKALAPEKYKDFVQTVALNRHGKNSSKEAGAEDTKQELSDLSAGRVQKRKRGKSSVSSKEEGSVRPWKRNRPEKENAHGKSLNKVSGHTGHGAKQQRKLNRPQYGGQSTFRRDKVVKNNKGNVSKRSFSSKSPKHKKMGRKDKR